MRHCFGLLLRLWSDFFASRQRLKSTTFQVINAFDPWYLLSAFEGNLITSTASLKAQISVVREASRKREFLNSALGVSATQRQLAMSLSTETIAHP